MSLRTATYVLFILLLPLKAVAQDITFTASAPAKVMVGQQFQYTVEGSKQGTVELPSHPDMVPVAGPYSSFSSSTQWINGKMTAVTTASYTYIYQANKPGTITLPPATVKVRKNSYQTNEVTIEVADAGGGSSAGSSSGNGQAGQATQTSNQASAGLNAASEELPLYLRIIPSRKILYLGEQFVSELKIFTSVNTRPVAGLKDVPYEGFYKQSLEADNQSTRENIDGKPHITQVLQRHLLIPQKAGKITIEPFESEWTIPKQVSGSRSNSMFDEFFGGDPFSDPFFNRVQDVPHKILTKPVTLTIKPLPAGAPKGFTGAVGDFSVTASISSDELNVNESLSYRITIKGTGNLPLLGAPKVSLPPDHDVYETTKRSNISAQGKKLRGEVTFEYPMVVRHAGSFRIPPVQFTWFDPREEKYMSASTKAFDFTVLKGDGDQSNSNVFRQGGTGEQVADLGSDIRDIIRESGDFSKMNQSPLQNLAYWLAYLVALIAAIVLYLTLRKRQKLHANKILIRNRRAGKMARSRLKNASRAMKLEDEEAFLQETEKALWGYLSDKLGIELSSLSRERVGEFLTNAGVELDSREELFKIIDQCELSRYAPPGDKSSMDSLYENAVALIRNLEQTIRK